MYVHLPSPVRKLYQCFQKSPSPSPSPWELLDLCSLAVAVQLLDDKGSSTAAWHGPPDWGGTTGYQLRILVPMMTNQQNRKAISRVETIHSGRAHFEPYPHLFFLLRPRRDHWGRHHINVAQHLDFGNFWHTWYVFFETSKHVTKANVENWIWISLKMRHLSFGSGNRWDLSFLFFFTSFHHHFIIISWICSWIVSIISGPGSDHRARRRSSETKGSSFRARSPSCRCRGFILDLT